MTLSNFYYNNNNKNSKGFCEEESVPSLLGESGNNQFL